MCKFYHYRHPCNHSSTVFAQYCIKGAKTQTKCEAPNQEIWQQFRVEDNCSDCYYKEVPKSSTAAIAAQYSSNSTATGPGTGNKVVRVAKTGGTGRKGVVRRS